MSELDKASTENHLESLCRMIHDEAKADVAQLNADAEAAAKAVLDQLAGRVAAIREPILAQAKDRAEAYVAGKQAEADLNGRHDWLMAREAVLEDLFGKLAGSLAELSRSAAYAQALPQWLHAATGALQEEELVLEADPQSRAVLEGVLSGLAEKLKIEWGQELPADKHGFVLSSKDGRRRYESTLEARLERLKPALRARALQMLTGGQDE